MGKSRSATLIIAYLLSTSQSSTPTTALMHLRQARSMAEPNPGFMDQLHLYHRMRCPSDIDSHPLYQRWCYKREVERSKQAAEAPGSEFIVFEDEVPRDGEKFTKEIYRAREGEEAEEADAGERGKEQELIEEEYRCRRCRTRLGDSSYLIPHTPHKNKASPSSSCAHIFLHPLSWMRPVLSEGNLDGRLECPNPRCGQNVGKYAWQGMKCSCGEWVVPGISVARGKLDVVGRRRNGGGDVKANCGGDGR
ncbi:MAG: hypothetical protein Q9219_000164 [cf. Caloplaca sp. 3 TL-2023]